MEQLSLEEMASLCGGNAHKKDGAGIDIRAKNIALVAQFAKADASGNFSLAIAENNAKVTQS